MFPENLPQHKTRMPEHPRFAQFEEMKKDQLKSDGLCPGILSGVGQALGLIVSDILDAEVLQHFEHSLAAVCESNSAMVGIALLDQHMTVEAAHFGDAEDADAAKATGGDG